MDINFSSPHLEYTCAFAETTIILSSISLLFFLLIPLLIFVLIVGFKQWSSSTFNTSNHSDIFTYNVVFLDLLGISGMYFMFFAPITHNIDLWKFGTVVHAMYSTGNMLFHLLTCMERYLAVVHPLYYLCLRGSAGARIRNVTIGCVWLISVGVMIITVWQKISYIAISFSVLSFTFVVFCFCSLSVLCALFRPGPGERVDINSVSKQSKRRALRPVVFITGALLLRFMSSFITSIVQTLSTPFGFVFCIAGLSSFFFLMPSSLVLPLLFLQRAGKLNVCGNKSNTTA